MFDPREAIQILDIMNHGQLYSIAEEVSNNVYFKFTKVMIFKRDLGKGGNNFVETKMILIYFTHSVCLDHWGSILRVVQRLLPANF